MEDYKHFDNILKNCIDTYNNSPYMNSVDDNLFEDNIFSNKTSDVSISSPSMNYTELIKWSNSLVKQLEKGRKFRVKNLPKYIVKNNEIINRMCIKQKKILEVESKKPENIYDFVKLVDDPDNKLECCALTKNYKQCKQPVKYKVKNINKDGEDDKNKYNVFFCTQHVKQLADSDDQKSLKYGFYFDSDIYSN